MASFSNVKVLDPCLYLSSYSGLAESKKSFMDYKLHPLLQEGLKRNGFKYITEIQQEVLNSEAISLPGDMLGRNTLLASDSGSGKTLAYLLPILNNIFHSKDAENSPKSGRKLFANAEDLYYERKFTNKKLSKDNLIKKSEMKGALIIGPSRELLNQIYSLIRRLDVSNTLRVNRVGSSVQLFSPIVEHITAQSEYRNKREISSKDMDSVSVKNIVNNSNWKLNDIMLATPMVFKFLVDDTMKYDPYNINPQTIVMDEFDLLFTNPGMSDAMLQILRKFGGERDKLFKEFNNNRQFLLSGSTLPEYIQGTKSEEFLNSCFKNLNTIQTSNFGKCNPNLKTQFIDADNLPLAPEMYLLSLIRKDIERNYNTVIFCDTQEQCDEISSILFNEEIPNLPYYAGLESTLRVETLHQLYKGKCRVIISTNIFSRGIDTCNIGHVIQYNFAKNINDYIHRVGRAGRMGKAGKVTNFVTQKDASNAKRIRNALGI
ncbi:unnamed protein product [Moneuplotes crassus]|uniref:ATP-dependent RNA helicase n=1 Tax=Euplotes crassus TaxID=5936 RepID=A0AAD1UE67_EUPCR|nr:unnamed protein product [Moneuplotes crassus]